MNFKNKNNNENMNNEVELNNNKGELKMNDKTKQQKQKELEAFLKMDTTNIEKEKPYKVPTPKIKYNTLKGNTIKNKTIDKDYNKNDNIKAKTNGTIQKEPHIKEKTNYKLKEAVKTNSNIVDEKTLKDIKVFKLEEAQIKHLKESLKTNELSRLEQSQFINADKILKGIKSLEEFNISERYGIVFKEFDLNFFGFKRIAPTIYNKIKNLTGQEIFEITNNQEEFKKHFYKTEIEAQIKEYETNNFLSQEQKDELTADLKKQLKENEELNKVNIKVNNRLIWRLYHISSAVKSYNYLKSYENQESYTPVELLMAIVDIKGKEWIKELKEVYYNN